VKIVSGALLVVGLALTTGCASVGATGPLAAKQRDYTPGAYDQRDPTKHAAPGSLFSESSGGYLEDTRALRVGDVVVIRIDENADAQGGATTKLNRDASMSMGANGLFGLTSAIQKAYPSIDPTKLLDIASKSSFDGAGNTARKGQLSGNIAVRVVRAMPNADLFVEGTKTVLINNEEYHLYVSGVLRPNDIGQDNTISSSRIADAQIEFTGRGDVTDQQRKGWLLRLLDALNPF
jgi:flagellar L-ring protein precursor FlgH